MFDPLAGMNDEQKLKAIKQAAKDVAATRAGKIFLAVIFENLYLFRETKNPEAQVLCNYGKWFIKQYLDDEAPYRAIEALLGG